MHAALTAKSEPQHLSLLPFIPHVGSFMGMLRVPEGLTRIYAMLLGLGFTSSCC